MRPIYLVLVVPFVVGAIFFFSQDASAPDEASSCTSPPSSALRVLSPVASHSEPPGDLDPTLLEHLQISVCKPKESGRCRIIKTWHGSNPKPGQGIRQVGDLYEVLWKPPRKPVEIHFSVANRHLGSVSYQAQVRGTTIIRFAVEPHPVIRAAALLREDAPADDVAWAVVHEFGPIEPACVAAILEEESCTCAEVGEVLHQLEQEPVASAQILTDLEFPASEICEDVLANTYGLGMDEATEVGCEVPGLRCAAREIPPVTAALDVLPPLDRERKTVSGSDGSLADFLTVSVCHRLPGICLPIAEFSSRGEPDAIRLRGKQRERGKRYEVAWKMEDALVDLPLEFRFEVAGLHLGSVPYTPTRRRLPIRFRVEPHPLVRAAVASAEDRPVEETADSLLQDFDLSTAELVWVLTEAGYPAGDVHAVLTDVAGIDDVFEMEEAFESACVHADDYLEHTARETVERFAPVLAFDGSYSGLPMSADEYFAKVMSPHLVTLPGDSGEPGTVVWFVPYRYPNVPCPEGLVRVNGRDQDPCGLANSDFNALTSGSVPTYFRVINDRHARDEGRLRIAYWWFYGWQPYCNPTIREDGAHHGDWEHIVVTTSPDRESVDAVTFFFHGASYTRQNFKTVGERPYVHVGKLGHGSYHSNQSPSCWMLGTAHHCCHYADCRNPKSSTEWSTQGNLVSLHGDAEAWMAADRVGSEFEHEGETYVISAWRWGPWHDFCHAWLFGWCADWGHSRAPSTHPTVDLLDWNLPDCRKEGCSDASCKGLVYTSKADFNEGWPW